jgi:hypothetical protein
MTSILNISRFARLTALALLIATAATVTGSNTPAEAQSRIKDIVAIEGVRDNLLVGYGLVVGLNGSGDTLANAPFTTQSLVGMLERLGVNTRNDIDSLNTANVAAVMVMPAGIDRVDAIETAHAFAQLKCKRMIVTRVDMTRRLGSLLKAAYESGLAFSDVSVSPEILGQNGGGLGTLNPVALARLMLPATLLHEDAEAEKAAFAAERISAS